MEHKKLKTQRGFLSIISIAIIVVVAIVSSMLLVMFSGNIKSTENVSQSKASFYLATSGLQVAKRNILVDNKQCKDINGQLPYPTRSLADAGISGDYKIYCCNHKLGTTLVNGFGPSDVVTEISVTATNISDNLASTLNVGDESKIILNNPDNAKTFSVNGGIVKIDDEYIAYSYRDGKELSLLRRGVEKSATAKHNSGTTVSQVFLNAGVIQIGNELIGYNKFSNNKFTGITRGIKGTTKEAHNPNDNVYQNLNIFYSTGWIPNEKNPTGMSLIEETLAMVRSSFSFGTYEPVMVSAAADSINLEGNIIIKNPDINSSDLAPGSTILSAGTVTLTTGATTVVGNISGSDGILRNQATLINTGNLFGYIFATDLTTIINNGIKISPNDINNIGNSYENKIVVVDGNVAIGKDKTINIGSDEKQPKIIVIDGNLIINTTGVTLNIGKSGNPTVIIVNGDFKVTGSNNKITIYGLLYVRNDFFWNSSYGCDSTDSNKRHKHQGDYSCGTGNHETPCSRHGCYEHHKHGSTDRCHNGQYHPVGDYRWDYGNGRYGDWDYGNTKYGDWSHGDNDYGGGGSREGGGSCHHGGSHDSCDSDGDNAKKSSLTINGFMAAEDDIVIYCDARNCSTKITKELNKLILSRDYLTSTFDSAPYVDKSIFN